MKTLISIDPGKSTGIAVGTYSDTEPFKLTHVFQIEGGVEGFVREVDLFWSETRLPMNRFNVGTEWWDADRVEDDLVFIAEKFNARGQGNGFSYLSLIHI